MLSSGIGVTPNFDTYYDDNFVDRIVKYPRSRICFITIRCPRQVKPWNKIGKSNDWIRRYSDCYYIVRGTKGGDHFHILAGIKKNVTMRYKKGIHFDVSTLAAPSLTKTREDWDEARISLEKKEFFKRQHVELSLMNLTVEQSAIVKKLALMVSKYWRKEKVRKRRKTVLSLLEKNVYRILDYMEGNLTEPREDQCIDLYRDFPCK